VYLIKRIKSDFAESKINRNVAFLFIPAALLTHLFHEFGHWRVGELLGDDMVLSLNNITSRSGYYIDSTHDIYILMGRPLFTIIHCLLSFRHYY
jgi:hypothetical protein